MGGRAQGIQKPLQAGRGIRSGESASLGGFPKPSLECRLRPGRDSGERPRRVVAGQVAGTGPISSTTCQKRGGSVRRTARRSASGSTGVQDPTQPPSAGLSVPGYEASGLAPESDHTGDGDFSVTCPGFHQSASRTMGRAGNSPRVSPREGRTPRWFAGLRVRVRGRRLVMRMLTAVALGSVVVLTGCATQRLTGEASLPPPRVVTTRPAPVPVHTPTTTRIVRRASPRVVATDPMTPPPPPSMELLGTRRPTAAPSANRTANANPSRTRVVPVSRTGLVQPAVRAPMVRQPAPAPVAQPAVAQPTRTRARPAPSSRDTRTYFQPARPCRPIPVDPCPGGG